MSNRRVLKGLRGLSSSILTKPSTDGHRAQVVDLPTDTGTQAVIRNIGCEKIIKGISVKKLSDKNKAKYYNYKIRRKAKSRSGSNTIGNDKDREQGN